MKGNERQDAAIDRTHAADIDQRQPPGGIELKTCRVCGKKTAERKPFCVDHSPYVQQLMALDQVEIAAQDILLVLGQQGELTVERVMIIAMIPPSLQGPALESLKEAGLIKVSRKKKTRRGQYQNRITLR